MDAGLNNYIRFDPGIASIPFIKIIQVFKRPYIMTETAVVFVNIYDQYAAKLYYMA